MCFVIYVLKQIVPLREPKKGISETGLGYFWRLLYLDPGVAIGQFMQAVRQFGFLPLHKRVVKCSAMKLLEAMDCVFEIRYDLKKG